MQRLCGSLALTLALTGLPAWAAGQSTAATVVGTIYDEQRGVLPGATLTLKNKDIGLVRESTSDQTGNFRALGLPPGPYEITVRLKGFATYSRSDIHLGISEEAQLTIVLEVAPIETTVEVAAEPAVGTSSTTLGRTFRRAEIEQLPVAARDFASLATLTPGIQTFQGARGATGVATAGQLSQNNTFLLDGLTLDDHVSGVVRGGVSLDAINEFKVMSNAFTAEHGQASGAIVSVLTRSGTNSLAARAFYFHRDDRWDATSGALMLTTPPGEKSRLEQKIGGGFIGGPLKRDRAFFFGSVERTRADSESVVTSPVLHDFLPDAPTRLPVVSESLLTLTRVDLNLPRSDSLTMRYRADGGFLTNQTSDPRPAGLIAGERRQDERRQDRDLALLHNHVLGTRGLNEIRLQFARRRFEADVSKYCDGCEAEDRPGILLGKSPTAPSSRTEDRWQFVNTLTYVVPDSAGDHAIKTGIDISRISVDSVRPAGHEGIFTFTSNNPAALPTRYFRSEGGREVSLGSHLYTVFLQDQWKPSTRMTFDLGLRWDYEDSIGVARDRDNVAPRLAVAFQPSDAGTTTIRGSYGIYYDLVLFNALISANSGSSIVQTIIRNPGYPDPFDRPGAAQTPPSTQRFGDDIRTPFTAQHTLGVVHRTGLISLSADGVWARGHNLPRTRNINSPLDGVRQDPTFQRINVRETEGHSWYKALQVGLEKRHSARYAFAIAYTLSDSQRDTENWDFLPVDSRNYDAERGPSANDVRHRLSASLNVDLPGQVKLAALTTLRSALPYNVTTGLNDNGDDETNDRPPGVARNSGRGDEFRQVDLRLSKVFKAGRVRIEVMVDAFNVTNQRNWTGVDGNRLNETFGKPTGAASPRELQVGVRVDF